MASKAATLAIYNPMGKEIDNTKTYKYLPTILKHKTVAL